jgi:hypothetical protein
MLYRELIADCFKIHKKKIHFGQDVEMLIDKLVVHIVTTGKQSVKYLLYKAVS